MSSHKDVEPPIYGYIAEFDHPEPLVEEPARHWLMKGARRA